MRALVRILAVVAILSPLGGCRGQGQDPSLAQEPGPNGGDRYFAARPAFPWAETGPGKSFTLAGPSDSVPDRRSTFSRLLRPRGGAPTDSGGANSLVGPPAGGDSFGSAPAGGDSLGTSIVSGGTDVVIGP